MFDLNKYVLFSVHGNADAGGGVAGAVGGFLSFMESLLRLSPEQIFASIVPGISGLDNLHPLFVHFPIALLGLFFVLDLIGSWSGNMDWRRTASWFLYAGTFFAGITVVMGLIAAGSVAHGGDVHEIMENHEHLGISVLLTAAILSVWRLLAKNQIAGAANTLYLMFAAILTGLLILTADLGGLMVYQYGVAVEPVTEINKAAAALHEHGADNPAPGHVSDSESPEIDPEQHHNHDHSH